MKSGTTYGISTAHHCDVLPGSYDGASLGATSALSNRDVRWTRFNSASAASKSFRADWSDIRTVTSAADAVVGANVCHFGISTGKACSTVASKNNCVTYEGWPQFCGLFRTTSKVSDVGDSGGPWYGTNAARGVHSGSIGGSSLFSGIGSLALLNVVVNK